MLRKIKISLSDFHFLPVGRGTYVVKYWSPVTNYCWMARVTDMTLIDASMYAPNCCPKRKDLEILRRYVKEHAFDEVKF